MQGEFWRDLEPVELEATAGFEPANEGFADPCLTTWPRRRARNGAGNGIRTRDPNLGKVVLYH